MVLLYSKKVRVIVKNMAGLGNKDIPLEKAKAFIIKALTGFDENLGRRAERILNESSHNIVENPELVTGMMACRPAGVTEADLKSMDMWMEDDVFQERFFPNFTEQENLSNKAVIDLEYDGTAQSVSWLSHELGHAVADDIQQEQGKCFRDFSTDVMEQQAYFIQMIVSDAIIAEKAVEVTRDDLGLGSIQSSFNRVGQVEVTKGLYNQAQKIAGHERSHFIVTVMGGRNENNLSETVIKNSLTPDSSQ